MKNIVIAFALVLFTACGSDDASKDLYSRKRSRHPNLYCREQFNRTEKQLGFVLCY